MKQLPVVDQSKKSGAVIRSRCKSNRNRCSVSGCTAHACTDQYRVGDGSTVMIPNIPGVNPCGSSHDPRSLSQHPRYVVPSGARPPSTHMRCTNASSAEASSCWYTTLNRCELFIALRMSSQLNL